MKMGFEGPDMRGRMNMNPEERMQRNQSRESAKKTLRDFSHQFDDAATKVLHGPQGDAIRDEVSRFADKITKATEGLEEQELLARLESALIRRNLDAFSEIGDDQRERQAFLYSLARAHLSSLQ